MSIVVKVLEIDEREAGDIITLQSQRDGATFNLSTDAGDDIEALKRGKSYTIAFVPFTEAGNIEAKEAEAIEATAHDTPVPVDHPVVMDTLAAHDAEPSAPEEDAAPETGSAVLADPTPATPAETSLASQPAPSNGECVASASECCGQCAATQDSTQPVVQDTSAPVAADQSTSTASGQ